MTRRKSRKVVYRPRRKNVVVKTRSSTYNKKSGKKTGAVSENREENQVVQVKGGKKKASAAKKMSSGETDVKVKVEIVSKDLDLSSSSSAATNSAFEEEQKFLFDDVSIEEGVKSKKRHNRSREDNIKKEIKEEEEEEEEIDYHKLYLQRTKRNPKIPKGNHKCGICGRTYVYFSQLRQHSQRHEKWKCSELGCGLQYAEKSKYFNHLATFHGKKKDELVDMKALICPICNKQFGSAKEVSEHRAVHDINGKYACKHCEKTFFYWQSRKTHQKSCGMKTEIKKKPRQRKVNLDEKEEPPRVKRAYRKKVPPIPVLAALVKMEQDLAERIIAPVALQQQVKEEISYREEISYQDTPLDLSMKTGKCWDKPKKNDAFKTGKGWDKPKKKDALKHTVPDAASSSKVPETLSEEKEQELLKKVLGRRDCLWDIDVSTANPEVVRMCNEAVEKAREMYFGKNPNYKKIDLLGYTQELMRDHQMKFEEAVSSENLHEDEITLDVVGLSDDESETGLQIVVD